MSHFFPTESVLLAGLHFFFFFFPGVTVLMQLSTIPLSIINAVGISFSGQYISACKNAKDAQSF